MIIEKLRFRNLNSYGDNVTEIDLQKTKTTLVVGPNGRGKSTPFTDGLMFALYNKPFRNVNKSQLINSINDKNLLVELEFRIGAVSYLVRRGSKPTVFEIYENGVMIPKPASDPDYQKFLEKSILRMSAKAFAQIVILGKANYIQFLNLPAPDRRKIVEDLLDLDIFSVMNKVLKKKVDANNDELRGSAHTLQLIETTITQKRKAIDAIQKQSDMMVANIDRSIADYREKSAAFEQAIVENLAQSDEIKSQLAVKQEELQKFLKFRSLNGQVLAQIAKYETELQFYEHTSECSTCKQVISEDFKKQKTDSLIADIAAIREQLPKLNKKIAMITALEMDIDNLGSRSFDLDTKRSHIVADQRMTQRLIQEAEASKAALEAPQEDREALDRDLDKLVQELNDANVRRGGLLKDKSILEASALLLKDGGIKNRIIKQYIPLMNKLLKKYLSLLDFDVSFELDENFDEVVRERNMEKFTFNSFSEGEKARIEMALLFTWRELTAMRVSSNSNLLVLDETFDGSLDAQGGDDLLTIFAEASSADNIVVISHKTDAYTEKFDRTLTIVKKRGFSFIKET